MSLTLDKRYAAKEVNGNYGFDDLYGFKNNPVRRNNQMYLWNPYKHRIILETHFRFPKDVTFFYFPKGIDHFSLTLSVDYQITTIDHLRWVGQVLLHLNPNIHYHYFLSLMYELVHPTSVFIDHTKIYYSDTAQYDAFCKDIFDSRVTPVSRQKKKFYFSPKVNWNPSELSTIMQRVANPLFEQEAEILKQMKLMLKDPKSKFTFTEIATLFDVTPAIMKAFIRNDKVLLYTFKEGKRLYRYRKRRHKKDRYIYTLMKEEIARQIQIDIQKAQEAVDKFDRTKEIKEYAPYIKKLIYEYWRKRRKFMLKKDCYEAMRAFGSTMTEPEMKVYYEYYMKWLKSEDHVIKYLKNVMEIDIEKYIESNFGNKIKI